MNRGPEKLGRLIGAIVVIGLFLLLSGCGVYRYNTPGVKISKVLTITAEGDTLAVDIKQFQKYNYNNVFDNYRYNFNYGFGYYNYFYPFNYGFNYPWHRPNTWYYRDWYYQPKLPQLKPIFGRRGSDAKIIIGPRKDRGNNSNLNLNNNNNNDQIIRNYFNRGNNSSEGSNNGRRSWSGENIPAKPVRPIITPPSQSRQIYRGSGSSGIQQSGAGSSISRSGSGGVSGRKN